MSILNTLTPSVIVDPPLYVPPDIWHPDGVVSVHCGPSAVAAVMGKTCTEVAESGTDLYRHMNTTEARRAVRALGSYANKVEAPDRAGLAHVMWDGPWSTVARAAYRYSHWIAYRRVAGVVAVYDINAGSAGGWLTFPEWERDILPFLLPKRATGYHVNMWLEVQL